MTSGPRFALQDHPGPQRRLALDLKGEERLEQVEHLI
jgi:hypothetical protein